MGSVFDFVRRNYFAVEISVADCCDHGSGKGNFVCVKGYICDSDVAAVADLEISIHLVVDKGCSVAVEHYCLCAYYRYCGPAVECHKVVISLFEGYAHSAALLFCGLKCVAQGFGVVFPVVWYGAEISCVYS